jgi:hypothetical protein
MPATRERTNPRNGNDNRRGELVRRVEGRLGADARIARLMLLGAIHFSATWYRARPRGRAGVDLDTLAAETSALFLREAPP